MTRNRKDKGFTMIEMMVVAAIIAMLAIFVVPKLTKKLGKAKVNIAKGQISLVCSAIEDFALDCDRFPSADEGLQALLVEPDGLAEGKWDGVYIDEKKLIDPWDNRFMYVIEEGKYKVISLGPDGTEGTEDDIISE